MIRQNVLLEQQLRGVVDVLPLAASAATGSEMRADRVNAVGRGVEQGDALGDGVTLADLDRTGDQPLAGDGVGHEHGLALVKADTRAAVGDRFDG